MQAASVFPIPTARFNTIHSYDDVCLLPILLGTRFLTRTSVKQLLQSHLLKHAEQKPQLKRQASKTQCRRNSADHVLRVPTLAIVSNEDRWYLLGKEGKWRVVWEVLGDFFVLISVVSTFYFLAVESDGIYSLVIENIVWSFFVLDFLRNCLTIVEDSKGRRIHSLRYILLAYAKGELLWDIIALLPLRFAGYPEIEYYLRVVRLRKVPGTLNFVDGSGIGLLILYALNFNKSDNTKAVGLTSKIIGLAFQLIAELVLGTFLLGCFWLWFSDKVRNLSSRGSFLDRTDIVDCTDWQRMERAWYFMLTTMCTIGYGDYSAMNPYERVCLIGLMFVGVAIFSMTIGKINSMMTEYHDLTTPPDYTGSMMQWLTMLQQRYSLVPSHLRTRVISHFHHFYINDPLKGLGLTYNIDDNIDVSTMYLSDLDVVTVKRVINYLFEELFLKYKLFFNVDTEFKYEIAYYLQPRTFNPDEEILGEEEETEEVYFLVSGTVTCGVYEANKQYTALLTYNKRAVIGDYTALTGIPMPVVYRTPKLIGADMMVLPIKPLQTLLNQRFPGAKTKLSIQAAKKMQFLRNVVSQHYHSVHLNKVETLIQRVDAVNQELELISIPINQKISQEISNLKNMERAVETLVLKGVGVHRSFRKQRRGLLKGVMSALDRRVDKRLV